MLTNVYFKINFFKICPKNFTFKFEEILQAEFWEYFFKLKLKRCDLAPFEFKFE